MKLLYWVLLGIGIGILVYVLYSKYRQSQQFRKPANVDPILPPEGFDGVTNGPQIWLTPEAVQDKVELMGEYRMGPDGNEEFIPANGPKNYPEHEYNAESDEDESDTEEVEEVEDKLDPVESEHSEQEVPAEDIVEIKSE